MKILEKAVEHNGKPLFSSTNTANITGRFFHGDKDVDRKTLKTYMNFDSFRDFVFELRIDVKDFVSCDELMEILNQLKSLKILTLYNLSKRRISSKTLPYIGLRSI